MRSRGLRPGYRNELWGWALPFDLEHGSGDSRSSVALPQEVRFFFFFRPLVAEVCIVLFVFLNISFFFLLRVPRACVWRVGWAATPNVFVQRMKERRYLKIRRAKWRAGALLVLKSWRINLAEATEVCVCGGGRFNRVEAMGSSDSLIRLRCHAWLLNLRRNKFDRLCLFSSNRSDLLLCPVSTCVEVAGVVVIVVAVVAVAVVANAASFASHNTARTLPAPSLCVTLSAPKTVSKS